MSESESDALPLGDIPMRHYQYYNIFIIIMIMEDVIERIRVQAVKDGIPIMESDALYYFVDFIQENNIKSILEVGTAIGYSASVIAYYNPQVHIVSIEKDPERYKQAFITTEAIKVSDRIKLVNADAREYTTDEKFDLIFLDGPKAHNQELLEHYNNNLNPKGFVAIDDVYFHGYVDNPETIHTRSLRSLVRKLSKFKEDFENNKDYDVTYLQIGDGLLIGQRRY